MTASTLLDTVTGVLDDLAEHSDHQGPVVAIGVSGMGEAGALLDAADEARGPVVAWFDRRGAEELSLLPDDLRRDFAGRTGLPLVELVTLAKLWHRIRTEKLDLTGLQWHNVPELVVRRLGGERHAEPSLVARTGLLDQDTGALWPRAVEVLGASASLVPPMLTAGSVWGHATTGIPPAMSGAVLTVAGHDHLVSSVATGIVDLETLYDSMGTAEALIRVLDGVLDRDARARLAAQGVNVLRHLLPGRGVMLAATRSGLLMRRVLQLVGVEDAAGRAALDAQVMLLPDRPAAVAVSGAKNDDGVLVIRADADGLSPALLFEASLQHGCAVLQEVLAVMDTEQPPATRSVLAGGWVGMSSVRRSRQRILPGVRFSERDEDTAYGAALIAAFAADPAVEDLAAYLSDTGRGSW
jgi:sugar (pentulose or hexulose) kinase